MIKSKTNFHSLLVAHLYFPLKRLFLPLFFCLLQNEHPSSESYLKALTKFQNDFKLKPEKVIVPLDCCFV